MTAAKVEGFIHGAHHLSPAPGGLVCPQRLSAKQFDVAKAAGRDRAASYTAGVTIRLVTTGDELSFDLAVLRPLHYASDCVADTVERAEAAGDARAAEAGVADGIDLVVDGRYVCTAPVADGPLTLRFENPTHAPAEVCVYLPCLMSVAVGNLATNGRLEQAPERPYLLALGDSITQGYVVGAPSMSWPARLARSCGLDLVNQAIAGHHFDAGTLRGMGVMRTRPPALVVVAYGTNDWSHAPDKRVLAANIKKYLRRLAQRFEGTPIYVLTPIWRADEGEARPHGKSLAWVRETIADNCRKLGLRCIDGSNLVARDRSLFADGRLHPNAAGAGSMAAGVLAALERDGILAQLGGRHDTPAARAEAQTLLRPGAPAGQPECEAAVRVIWRLRQADGCPWDREQTHASIAKNMIEEAYEAVDAIEAGDADHLCDELGDVLMQVLLHAQIAADAGEFTFADVCRALTEKLVRRHPHVFGGQTQAGDAGEVLGIWSQVKLEERKAADERLQEKGAPAAGLLDDVPRALPALLQAQKVSRKAAACGFDWESTDDVWRKVDEERGEFAAEPTGSDAALEEFGDVLFAAVNVARKEGIDAESALRASTEKFRRRWAAMEAAASARGRALEDLSHDELEELWAAAKDAGHAESSNLS